MEAKIIGAGDLNGNTNSTPHDAHDVVVAMDFSTPDITSNHSTPARFCAYVTKPGQLTLMESVDVGQNGHCKEVDFITICELGRSVAFPQSGAITA